jgi:hypothetical protein
MRNFTILILLLTTVLCGKAQDLLVPCSQLYYGGKTYHELIYKYLIYDNPKQAYAGYIGLWEPYYLVITQYNTIQIDVCRQCSGVDSRSLYPTSVQKTTNHAGENRFCNMSHIH